jgi:WD40 repeat protein
VRALLDAELQRLPEKWRLPLILCYLEGRTQDEAAGQLGCGKRTLRRRLEEARAALGRRLTRRGVVWPAVLSAVLLSECAAPAALAPRLLGSAVEVAAHVMSGQAATAVVSAEVVALTKGVQKTMLLTRLKIVTAVLLLAGLALGAGLFCRSEAAQPAAPPKAEQAAAQDRGKPKAGRKPVVIKEEAQIHRVAWSPDGALVATTGTRFEVVESKDGDGKKGKALLYHSAVKLWDARTGELRNSLGEEGKTYITALAFSPDKKTLAYAAFTNSAEPSPVKREVRLVDIGKGSIQRTIEVEGSVQALAFSPDGKTLACGGSAGAYAEAGSSVKLWDVPNAKWKGGTKVAAEVKPMPVPVPKLGEVPKRGGCVLCLAFSPDGKVLAAGDLDGKIRLFDGQTGAAKKELEHGEVQVLAVAFLDGKRLVSAGGISPDADAAGAGAVKIWDVRAGKLLRSLEKEGSAMFQVAASPAGGLLATGGFRKGGDKRVTEILLWDAASGDLKQALPQQDFPLFSFAFSPDGRNLAVVGGTGGDLTKDGGKTTGAITLIPLP